MDSSLTTPTALLTRVREVDAVRRAAELELLQLAALWADAHPDLDSAPSADPDDPGAEFDEWRGIPGVAWDASAGLGDGPGPVDGLADRLIRQALTLRHRLPLHWGLVLDGSLESYRARRIADAVAGCPDDICAHVDEHVAPVAATIGPVRLERILEEAWILLHEEEVELERLAALEARHVTIDDSSLDHTGVADLTARADWDDLAAFDETLAAVAGALAVQDEADDLPADSLDVRRSRALGVLADPARAQALLDGRPAPSPTRRTQLNLHLTLDTLLRHGLLGRDGHLDRPLLAEAVRDWCGRTDRGVTVAAGARPRRPRAGRAVRDHAAGCASASSSPTRPASSRGAPGPSHRCDVDHRVPYDDGGASCDCNLAPLCRRHHRLKTHRGYRYTVIEPGTFLWSTPHGLQLLRDPGGTRDVTPRSTRAEHTVGRLPGRRTGRSSRVRRATRHNLPDVGTGRSRRRLHAAVQFTSRGVGWCCSALALAAARGRRVVQLVRADGSRQRSVEPAGGLHAAGSGRGGRGGGGRDRSSGPGAMAGALSDSSCCWSR